MLPFINAYYALEDNKKKASKYFIKLLEHVKGSQNYKSNQESLIIAASSSTDDPTDEQFIFKHFYNNKRGLIK